MIHEPAPLLSIIVPTLNAALTLPRCLDSLAAQDFGDFEVVICDGVSADGTVEHARLWESRLPRLIVDSQRDGGIYQGINRGIRLSSGRWILVLGADDRLASPDTLKAVAPTLTTTPVRFVYGDVVTATENPWGPAGTRYPGPVDASKLLSTNICQQSVFYRRDLFDDYGPFRREYRVCADWDMALRVLGAEQAQWIDVVVAEYAATGMSSRTTDHRFRRDRPLLVAKMVLKRPLDDRFFNARYGLATFAREALRDGDRRVDAALLWGAAQWLAAVGALRGSKRRLTA